MPSWVDQIVKQHEKYESPLAFWRWAAIAAISATVKDNIWIDRGIYKLYPNIYVMFHAESGLKKGPPVSMANQLVKAVNNTRIISGRSSIQGILKELGTAYTAPGTPAPIMKSVAFICSSELSSSIVDDPVATKILTDLYDRQYRIGEWKSLLKMEMFELKDPTVTMLTASNEAMSEDFLTNSAVKGGYVARTFFIYESKRNRINSLQLPPKTTINYQTDADYLKELAKLSGGFKPTASWEQSDEFKYEFKDPYTKEVGYYNEAGIIYEQWYHSFVNQIDEYEIKDPTGTLNRFGDSVYKIALLLSLAERPQLEIIPEAMNDAIVICEKLIGNVRQATASKTGTTTDESDVKRKWTIIQELMNTPEHVISRTDFMKKYWAHGNWEQWDQCLISLEHTGMLNIESNGNQVYIKMPETQYLELKEFYEGRNKK